MHREYCSSQLLWSSNISRNAGGWIKPFLVSADANVFNCLLSRKEPAAHWIGETPLFSRMLQIVTVLGNQAATQHTPSPQADHRELKQILWHNALFAFVAYSVCAHGSGRQFMITQRRRYSALCNHATIASASARLTGGHSLSCVSGAVRGYTRRLRFQLQAVLVCHTPG